MVAVLEKLTPILVRLRPWLERAGTWSRRLIPGGAVWKYLGYVAFFFASLVVFMVWTFPVDAVKQVAVRYAQKEYNLDLAIGDLGVSLPLGIHATNVGLYNFPDAEPNNHLPIKIDDLSVEVGLFSLLLGSPSVSVEANLFGGEVEGDFVVDQTNERYEADLSVRDIRYEKIPAVTNVFKELPVKGGIDFEVKAIFDQKKMEETQGTVRLVVRDGQIGPGKYGVELPKMVTGNLTWVMELKDRKATVTEYSHESPDVSSDMQGYVQLFPSLLNSRSNLVFRFKVSDELLNKNDILKMGMQVNAGAKGSDGYYYYVLRGSLKDLQFQQNRNAQKKFQPAAAPAARTPPGKATADKKTVQSAPKDRVKPPVRGADRRKSAREAREAARREKGHEKQKDAAKSGSRPGKFNFPLPGAKGFGRDKEEQADEGATPEPSEEAVEETTEAGVNEEEPEGSAEPENGPEEQAEPEEDTQQEEPGAEPEEPAETTEPENEDTE